jgi:hypothetical protein
MLRRMKAERKYLVGNCALIRRWSPCFVGLLD